MAHQKKIIIISLLISFVFCCFLDTNNRTQSVTTNCQNKNRGFLVSNDGQNDYKKYSESMHDKFNIDSVQFAKQMLSQKSVSYALDYTYNHLLGPYIWFTAPFLVGFIFLLLSSPLLLWCCICPTTCCMSDRQPASKLELYWPMGILLLILLGCLGGSVYGLMISSKLVQSVDNIFCASSILSDDLINGNTTISGNNFFLGLSNINDRISQLRTNIDSISQQLSSVNSTNMAVFTNRIDAAQEAISKIPNGNLNQSLSMSYLTPFSGTVSSSVNSSFNDFLGNASLNGTIIGGAYSAITIVDYSINDILEQSDGFVGSVDSFKQNVGIIQKNVSDVVQRLNDYDKSLLDVSTVYKSSSNWVKMVMNILLGVIVGGCSVGLVGISIAFCSGNYKFYYLTYMGCVALFIMGVICFLLTIGLSFLLPPSYIACQALQYSIQSQYNFNYVFQDILSAEAINYATTCLPSQSGDIQSLIIGNISSTIDNLTNAIQTLSQINCSDLTTLLIDKFNQIQTSIVDVQTNRICDLPSTAPNQYALLSKLSSHQQYLCSNDNFQYDSWIPTIQQAYIPCQIDNGQPITNCSSEDFSSNKCRGCLDTYQLFTNNPNIVDQQTAYNYIKTRYVEPDCDQFASQLSSTWSRFYAVKNGELSMVKNRFGDAQSIVSEVANDLSTTVANTFSNVTYQLTNVSDLLLDPKRGLLGGLNCVLVGQDVKRVIDVGCYDLFNIMYVLRILLGVISFGILMGVVMMVCGGVRLRRANKRQYAREEMLQQQLLSVNQ